MTPKAFKKRPYRRGVGAVLFNAQGLVFAAQRIDTPEPAWQFPQGGIDEDEKPKQALLRELKEEIGTDQAEIIGKSRHWLTYDLPPEIADKVWHGHYRGQKQRWFALRFTGTDADINLNAGHAEFSTWQWMPLLDLPRLIVPFKRPLYEQIVEEFRHLLP
ncbi:RNA pyrophosphohydrolase [Magnetospira thiophila]